MYTLSYREVGSKKDFALLYEREKMEQLDNMFERQCVKDFELGEQYEYTLKENDRTIFTMSTGQALNMFDTSSEIN